MKTGKSDLQIGVERIPPKKCAWMFNLKDSEIVTTGSERISYGKRKAVEKDVVSMVVQKDEIYFYINDECQGLAFKDPQLVEADSKYLAFVFIRQ